MGLEDGQRGAAADRLLLGAGRLGGRHLRLGAAPVEAELVRGGRHHHGRGSLRGAVDELRRAKHRAGAVQAARVAALAGRCVRLRVCMCGGALYALRGALAPAGNEPSPPSRALPKAPVVGDGPGESGLGGGADLSLCFASPGMGHFCFFPLLF